MLDVIRDRSKARYELNPNSWEGFTSAVQNGQTRLALEYLLNYLGEEREAAKAVEVAVAPTKVEAPTPAPAPVVEVAAVEAPVPVPRAPRMPHKGSKAHPVVDE